MPIYDLECVRCGQADERMAKVSELKKQFCKCGGKMKVLISTVSKPTIYSYYSENLGGWVTGPKQKTKLMRSKGLEEAQ